MYHNLQIPSQKYLYSETQASPTKYHTNKFIQSQLSTQNESRKLSQTQKQIYTHQLILNIMKNRSKNTIKHNIDNFDPDIILYAKPRPVSNIMEYSGQNNMYQSEYSKKISKINQKINKKPSLTNRIKNYTHYNKTYVNINNNKNNNISNNNNNDINNNNNNHHHKQRSLSNLVQQYQNYQKSNKLNKQIKKKTQKKRPLSAYNNRKQINNQLNKSKSKSKSQLQQNQDSHKKISVSGLVSYNFSSVNARKNLGFDFQHDNDKLNLILTKLQVKNKCCSHRQQSILLKNNQNNKLKAQKKVQIKNAIFSDFQTNTNQFLGNLNHQLKQDQVVYGMKWTKIQCIKQLMEQEKITFLQAEQIVNEIQQKKIKENKPKIKKIQIDEQLQLNNRKKVQQKNKVILKHLYFAQL